MMDPSGWMLWGTASIMFVVLGVFAINSVMTLGIYNFDSYESKFVRAFWHGFFKGSY